VHNAIIIGPGKYVCKSSRPARHVIADIKDVLGRFAIGWYLDRPLSWDINSGECLDDHSEDLDITGPYVEPPKPREVWIKFSDGGASIINIPSPGFKHFREVLP
jgi:hypothetical protein